MEQVSRKDECSKAQKWVEGTPLQVYFPFFLFSFLSFIFIEEERMKKYSEKAGK